MKDQAKAVNHIMAGHLKIKRQDENLTMRQLATRLETPHSFIGKIELKGRRLDVGEFVAYCKALGCDPVVELQAIVNMQ